MVEVLSPMLMAKIGAHEEPNRELCRFGGCASCQSSRQPRKEGDPMSRDGQRLHMNEDGYTVFELLYAVGLLGTFGVIVWVVAHFLAKVW